jgi:hypothetical protein
MLLQLLLLLLQVSVLESSKQRKRAVIVLEEMLAVSPRETALNFNILLNACAKVSSCSATYNVLLNFLATIKYIYQVSVCYIACSSL